MESIKIDHEIKTLNYCFTFKYSLKRVWNCFRIPEIINQSIKNQVDSITITSGRNYSEVGTTVHLELKNSIFLELEVKEVVDTENYKEIKFKCQQIKPFNFELTCNFLFFWDTTQEITQFKFELVFFNMTTPKVFDFVKNELSLFEIGKVIKEILENKIDDLNFYESITIKKNIEKIWKISSNWEYFKRCVPISSDEFEYEGENPRIIGSKIILRNTSENKSYVFKVKDCFDSIERKKIVMEFIGDKPNNQKQEFEISLIYVNEYLTFLSIDRHFKDKIKSDLMEFFKNETKNILIYLNKSFEKLKKNSEKKFKVN